MSPEDHASLDGDPWIVLQTFTGHEFGLERDIVRSGFTVYVPRHMERRHRSRLGWRNSVTEIVRALFPGYAFVLGDGHAAAKFVSVEFNTTQRRVKRLPNLMTQKVIASVQEAERLAQRERWDRWSPDTAAVLHGLQEAIAGVLPKRFTRIGDLVT